MWQHAKFTIVFQLSFRLQSQSYIQHFCSGIKKLTPIQQFQVTESAMFRLMHNLDDDYLFGIVCCLPEMELQQGLLLHTCNFSVLPDADMQECLLSTCFLANACVGSRLVTSAPWSLSVLRSPAW
jgi:hypothetical protein